MNHRRSYYQKSKCWFHSLAINLTAMNIMLSDWVSGRRYRLWIPRILRPIFYTSFLEEFQSLRYYYRNYCPCASCYSLSEMTSVISFFVVCEPFSSLSSSICFLVSISSSFCLYLVWLWSKRTGQANSTMGMIKCFYICVLLVSLSDPRRHFSKTLNKL